MRKGGIVLFILFTVFYLAGAQTQRIVLLEEATNASCPPCASNNPVLQSFYENHFGGVISVRYHAWWPGVDPMYDANRDDNKTRIQFYGINGVPAYAMDGHYYSDSFPFNGDEMTRQMYEHLTEPSPVKIRVTADFDDAAVHVHVDIIALQDVAADNLKLRVAIIERRIDFGGPAGGNGESVFNDVMRKMLPNGAGTSVDAMTPGDSLAFDFTGQVQDDWIWEDLGVVAWLQSDNSKKVLQAAMNFPTFILEKEAPGLDILPADSITYRRFKIVNHYDQSCRVGLSMKNTSAPEDWDYALYYQDTEYKTVEVNIPAGDSLLFSLKIHSGRRGTFSTTVFAENLSDPQGYGYGFRQDYLALVAQNNDVLLIDDDGGQEYQQNFEDIMDNLGVSYATIPQAQLQELQQKVDVSAYKLVIWNASWAFPTFTEEDIAFLKSYLERGGNLMLLGQDIGWDIFDTNGNSHFPAAQNFYHTYLDAQFVADNAASTHMDGLAGDAIGNVLSFNLSKPYGSTNFFPEEIASYSGQSVGFLTYDNGKIGALHFDADSFRTVYLGIGLEEISGDNNRTEILKRTLEWAGHITGVTDDRPAVPQRAALHQNFPNPFNPKTVITYELPGTNYIELSVYNLLGQKVATLVSEKQSAGTYKVEWNASGFASGVYYYVLTTDQGFTQTKKLVLLK